MSQPHSLTAGSGARRTWMLAVIMAAGMSATSALAGDDETEREYLSRIEHELSLVQAMVSAAAQQAPTGQRVKFRYDWLQRDIEMLREGIRQHADAPRQPRPAPPLRGDYRQ